VTDKYHRFLDKLRVSGKVNMYAAGAELERKFELSREDARAILIQWMSDAKFVKPITPRKKPWKK
jgi:hypothetical protein